MLLKKYSDFGGGKKKSVLEFCHTSSLSYSFIESL
jgi:hypothetical protein